MTAAQAASAPAPMAFADVCRAVEPLLPAEPEAQKRAIIGYPDAVERFKGEIANILDAQGLRGTFAVPPWYETEEEAVFEEVWGKAGLAEWWKPPYDASPSAKVIGDDVYFLVDGRMQKMPQRIPAHRRQQLIRAILLRTPGERLDRDFHEVYLLDGCRVTVFKGALAKAGRDVIIFRRYIVPEYTFAEQAQRGTIPAEAIPLFEAMVRVGYNVVFCGSVRSAKTTFLSTWQRLEDPALEGVMVETDPEIPLHRLMPGAPIVQLVCDGERLAHVSRNLLRSDADYFILAEARDGIALDMAVRVARKGTGRMKMTYHTRDPLAFPEDAAVEIVRSLGGDVRETALRVAGSFDYLFHFASLPGGAKRLKGIYEMGVRAAGPSAERSWHLHAICRHDQARDAWIWNNNISPDKRLRGEEGDPAAFAAFASTLAALAAPQPEARP
ncbi:MAG: CpaF/VirB11 family protein [Clostridiales Family XIII bacterium]|jgi:pilus assembly protein CpaF|nr:CpaF/VirB11 family protein [Clostridiales Family XIII bacterium]